MDIDKTAPKTNFRLRGKRLFLTYPTETLDITDEGLIEKFRKIFLNEKNEDGIKSFVLAREKADGKFDYNHLHVYIELSYLCDISDKSLLTINGVAGKYKVERDVVKALRYITKSGKYSSDGIDVVVELSKGFKKPFDRFVYLCKNKFKDRSEALSYLTFDNSDDENMFVDYFKSEKRYSGAIETLFKKI